MNAQSIVVVLTVGLILAVGALVLVIVDDSFVRADIRSLRDGAVTDRNERSRLIAQTVEAIDDTRIAIRVANKATVGWEQAKRDLAEAHAQLAVFRDDTRTPLAASRPR